MKLLIQIAAVLTCVGCGSASGADDQPAVDSEADGKADAGASVQMASDAGMANGCPLGIEANPYCDPCFTLDETLEETWPEAEQSAISSLARYRKFYVRAERADGCRLHVVAGDCPTGDIACAMRDDQDDDDPANDEWSVVIESDDPDLIVSGPNCDGAAQALLIDVITHELSHACGLEHAGTCVGCESACAACAPFERCQPAVPTEPERESCSAL